MPKKSKRRFDSHRHTNWVRWLFSAGVFCGVIGVLVFILLIHDLPDLDEVETNGRRASVVFESYDGKVLATYGDLFRKAVRIDQLPKYVGDAVVAIEDHRFYQHNGVDVVGMLRALVKNLANRRVVQGGSTLTQQVAKNLFFSQERSIKRKIQEIVLALWLEKKFTKKQILSIYINRVYFGAGTYGIDAAAYRFFGKQSSKLTLYEAASLIGLLKSPTAYSPLHHKDRSIQRTALVLDQMVKLGYITDRQKQDAMQDKDRHNNLSVLMDENRYFTDWVFEQMQNIVNPDKEDLIVRTTLDARLQKNATYIIREVLHKDGFKNSVSQMALVALDKTGAVRAMVGGHSYNISQFNRVLSLRSFGSAFKYFVFLQALENGMNPDDEISDMPLRIGDWSPKNYHYHSIGSIPLKLAFAKSVNTCTVRLAQKVGMESIVQKAHLLGISSNLNRTYATALGADGVSLLELTAAYGATMTGGIKVVPFGIISIKNRSGKVLYQARRNGGKRVISSDVCAKMKTLLSEVINNGTGRKAKLSIPCYGKTGTSNDSRDASFIGFSPPLVTGVWIGNDDNAPMYKKITGGTLPAVVWHKFMMTAFGLAPEASDTPTASTARRYEKRKKLKTLIENNL